MNMHKFFSPISNYGYDIYLGQLETFILWQAFKSLGIEMVDYLHDHETF